MNNQIKQRWIDGYSIQNIALIKKVSIEHVCCVLGFGYKGERK
tara:strand:- start:1713 stop:1841 length:129 start_codon:yes stop_codon:yes gene_type:complete